MEVRNLSDVELVRLCARDFDDQLAWEEFIDRFHKHVSLYVIRAFNAKSARPLQLEDNEQWETVRDLVQRVYIRLLENEGRAMEAFRGQYEGSIYTYLARIATTVVLDYLRQESADKRRGETISLDDLLLDGYTSHDTMQSWTGSRAVERLDGRLGERITIEDLTRRLENLLQGEKRQRDILVFMLHVFHGLTCDEIAARSWFGLTRRGVESVVRRIKRALLEENES